MRELKFQPHCKPTLKFLILREIQHYHERLGHKNTNKPTTPTEGQVTFIMHPHTPNVIA